ncbi:MAG: Nif3-like dinuclear metal center hexameric protein [Armatimonadetes bacterium]|nr:Nif3-like dinuclear metal center hexameric protein [Armatimonadota bacterium]
MVRVEDVAALIERIAPASLAEPWDNVGLMFGGLSWPVEHILLALDATPAVVAQAGGLRDAMIITHHPLFFEPIRALVEDDLAYHVVSGLAKADVALLSAHTNLDKSPTHGTARALAEALGLGPVEPLVPYRLREGEDDDSAETALPGFGGIVTLPQGTTRAELAALVAQRLPSRVVQLVGHGQGAAERVALVPGSGGDALGLAREAGAQAMVTGEIKHHEALEAEVLGPAVITAGHFQTERPVLHLLQRYLREHLPNVDIRIAEESSPIWSVQTGDSGG